MAADRKTILITGATGYIGRRLTSSLLAGGQYQLRLLVRNRHKVQAALAGLVEICEGSTFDLRSLTAALAGVDTAYYLIHSMGEKDDYQRLDRESAEHFRTACIAAGVRRIVYLGGLGIQESASPHLLSRLETGEILSSEPQRIETLWLRAGVIIGSGSSSYEIIRHLAQKLPLMITPRWVHTATQPIGIADVLAYLRQAIEVPVTGRLIVDIGGDRLSFKEMIVQAAEEMGLQRLLIPVPLFSPHLSSYWLVLFTPVPYRLAAALVEGLKSETVQQNDHAARYFPKIQPQSFRQMVQAAETELAQHQVLSRWCDSSAQQACDIKEFDNPGSAIVRDVRRVPFASNEQPAAVFRSACAIGGNTGWFRYDFLWRLRGLVDKLFGGYGLNRGRRDAGDLRAGDALDFWKVVDIRDGKRLLLYAQMKLPGQAWLEFVIEPHQLVQTAHFLPRGLAGRLYWYAIAPLHNLVFADLAATVVRRSRQYNSQDRTNNH